MRLRLVRRLAAVGAAVAVAATGLVAIGASPASAATVTVPLRCQTTLFGVAYDVLESVPVTMTAPASVDAGTAIPVTVSLTTPPANTPVPLGNVVLNAQITVSGTPATGGPSASATSTGTNSAPTNVAAYAPMPAPFPVNVSLPTTTFVAGNTINLRSAEIRINIVSGDDGAGGGLMSCTPEPSPGPTVTSVFLTSAVPSSPVDQCTAYSGDLTGGPGCGTQQVPQATLLPGSLYQQAFVTAPNPNSTTIDLGTTTTAATSPNLTAPLNRVTVVDTRGGSFQWSLTATMTNLTSTGGGTINANRVSITPACVSSGTGSAPGAVAGSANQSFGGPAVSLCTGPSVPDLTSGTTGGQWDVTGPVTLSVPPFQAAGNYVATMTINLA